MDKVNTTYPLINSKLAPWMSLCYGHNFHNACTSFFSLLPYYVFVEPLAVQFAFVVSMGGQLYHLSPLWFINLSKWMKSSPYVDLNFSKCIENSSLGSLSQSLSTRACMGSQIPANSSCYKCMVQG